VKRRASLRALFAFGAVACAGCAADLPPPPRAPRLTVPGDALPADLDCVVRIDLSRVRSALGPLALAGLRRGAAATATDLAEGWIADAIERSDLALVAFRPELEGGGPDNVIVLRGRFQGVKPPSGPKAWGPSVDLGADVRRFDRLGPVPRSSPARLYAFRDEQLVFVSAAEIDAVEALLEGGRAASTVQPPARGVIAFAARLRGVQRTFGKRFPILASALGDARAVSGSLEARGDGLVAEVALELETDEQAQRVAELARSVATVLGAGESRWAGPARATKLESAGHFAVLRAVLSRAELAGFLPAGE
jgi:hypothetical protein